MTAPRTGLGAAWAESSRTSRRSAPPLSREQIVDGALRYLAEHSLADLSMRRLAAYLGTAATSMYWHVPTKEQLLDLVLDEIIGLAEVPAPTDDWRADITAALSNLRDTLRAHRGAAALVVSRPNVGPKTLTAFEFVLATLRRAGFDDDQIPYVYDLLTNYVIGSVLVESSWQDEQPDGATDPAAEAESADEIGRFVAALPVAQFPTMQALADRLFQPDEDAKFRYGLARLLDGVSTDLP